jgi:hypothetical protein
VPVLAFLRYKHSSQQRLGALKVFVALLDSQRRSTSSEQLDRRILSLLVSEPSNSIELGARKRRFPNNQAEELLKLADAPSLLFTVTAKMVARVREWARIFGFVGSGNQITERGLLLQHLMGRDQIEAVRAGRLAEYNPFRLSLVERIFFWYTLLERDALWPFLIRRISEIPDGKPISGRDADVLTTQALQDLLRAPRAGLSGSEMLLLRRLRELEAHMAASLGLKDAEAYRRAVASRGPIRTGLHLRTAQAQPQRNTADDQAIPRFENLVDVGLLTKESADERTSPKTEESWLRRLEWRYFAGSGLRDWREAVGEASGYDRQFLWSRFARCAAPAFNLQPAAHITVDDGATRILELVREAFSAVRRPVGHTPFESVALIAMIRGLERGVECEMATIHELFIRYKTRGLFSEHLKFASGNELDRMFIDIRPDFFEAVRRTYGQ